MHSKIFDDVTMVIILVTLLLSVIGVSHAQQPCSNLVINESTQLTGLVNDSDCFLVIQKGAILSAENSRIITQGILIKNGTLDVTGSFYSNAKVINITRFGVLETDGGIINNDNVTINLSNLVNFSNYGVVYLHQFIFKSINFDNYGKIYQYEASTNNSLGNGTSYFHSYCGSGAGGEGYASSGSISFYGGSTVAAGGAGQLSSGSFTQGMKSPLKPTTYVLNYSLLAGAGGGAFFYNFNTISTTFPGGFGMSGLVIIADKFYNNGTIYDQGQAFDPYSVSEIRHYGYEYDGLGGGGGSGCVEVIANKTYNLGSINVSAIKYAYPGSSFITQGGSGQVFFFNVSTKKLSELGLNLTTNSENNITENSHENFTIKEEGLPYNTTWSINYGGKSFIFDSPTIILNFSSNSSIFNVNIVDLNGSIYYPYPSAGEASNNKTILIDFFLPSKTIYNNKTTNNVYKNTIFNNKTLIYNETINLTSLENVLKSKLSNISSNISSNLLNKFSNLIKNISDENLLINQIDENVSKSFNESFLLFKTIKNISSDNAFTLNSTEQTEAKNMSKLDSLLNDLSSKILYMNESLEKIQSIMNDNEIDMNDLLYSINSTDYKSEASINKTLYNEIASLDRSVLQIASSQAQNSLNVSALNNYLNGLNSNIDANSAQISAINKYVGGLSSDLNSIYETIENGNNITISNENTLNSLMNNLSYEINMTQKLVNKTSDPVLYGNYSLDMKNTKGLLNITQNGSTVTYFFGPENNTAENVTLIEGKQRIRIVFLPQDLMKTFTTAPSNNSSNKGNLSSGQTQGGSIFSILSGFLYKLSSSISSLI